MGKRYAGGPKRRRWTKGEAAKKRTFREAEGLWNRSR